MAISLEVSENEFVTESHPLSKAIICSIMCGIWQTVQDKKSHSRIWAFDWYQYQWSVLSVR